MINLKNEDDTRIEIGDNHIKFCNEILKISNISRTWIFRFTNIEKRKFEEQKRAYDNAKAQYEEAEKRKRSDATKNRYIAAVVCLILAIVILSSSAAMGFLLLCLSGIIGYTAYRESMREIRYPQSPPVEKEFPDKFGLSIEMNSGHIATFSAIGGDGVRALSKLQKEIDAADVHKAISIFNMNDYNITVENNEGIISTGDNTENNLSREE